MSEQEKKAKILIVDDISENRKLIARIIKDNTDYSINLANNGKKVLESIDTMNPDLILLDVMMPEMNGYDVAKKIKSNKNFAHVPILFITSITDTDGIVRGFNSGGVDYISKPFNHEELLARIKTHIDLKILHDDLELKNALLADRELHLAKQVEEKTKQIEEAAVSLVSAIENANLFNDNDTGNHIKRVSEYSYLLAGFLGCSSDFCRKIKLYASLHDAGKVGISDNILKKKGKYNKEEFEKMKRHVVIGGEMLAGTGIDPMARNIALYHHEKWDGSGYINGISGENIPLEARIVALADTYDALGSKRAYKSAFDESEINKIIIKDKGTHFQPELVELLLDKKSEFLNIKKRLGGPN